MNKINIKKNLEISDIIQSVPEGALLMLDIDDTVLRSRTRLGSEDYLHHRIDSLMAKGMNTFAATKHADILYNKIQKASPPALLADERYSFSTFIETLVNKKRASIIGLTARQTDLAAFTVKQLEDLNIHFSKQVLEDGRVSVLAQTVTIQNGIIFTGGVDKGKSLDVAQTHFKPGLANFAHIVFVDDRPSNCLAVSEYLSELGLSHTVYHYPYVRENHPFGDSELKIAQYQEDVFNKTGYVISDERAFESINDILKETEQLPSMR